MKKFISFFCALAIVLSANAAPQLRPDRKVAYNEKKTLKVAPPRTIKKNAPAATKFSAVRTKAAAFGKKTPVRAPKAQEATIVLDTWDEVDYNDLYFTEEGWWQVVARKDNIGFSLSNLESTEIAGTYLWEDMDDEYTYFYDYDTDEEVYFVDGTVVVTVDEEETVTFVASLVGDDGNNYEITIVATAPEPVVLPEGGEYTADKTDFSFYSSTSDAWYTLVVDEINARFNFDVFVAEGLKDVESGKTYTLDDMDSEFSYASVLGETLIYKSASFTKTVAEDGSSKIVAVVVDESGNTWTISIEKAAPRITEQTLTLDGVINQGGFSTQIEAADADTTTYLSLVIWSDEFIGTFTEEDLFSYASYVAFAADGDYSFYNLIEAEFTVTQTGEDTFTLTGTLLTASEDDETDQILFTVALKLTILLPEKVEIGESITGSDFELQLLGDEWLLEGYSDEGLMVGINGLSEVVAGHYDASNLDDYYTYITADGETYYDMIDADLTVTFEDNIITIVGTLTLTNEDNPNDVITLDVNITGTFTLPTERHYTYDAEDEAFDQTFGTFDVDDSYLARSGVLYVEAENEQGAIAELMFLPLDGESTLTPGVYPVEASAAPGTLYQSSGLNSNNQLTYSFFGFLDDEGYISAPVWFLVDGAATVSEDGVIEVEGLNSFGQRVHAVLGGTKEGIDNVSVGAGATKRLVNGTLVIEKNGTRYNALGTIVK